MLGWKESIKLLKPVVETVILSYHKDFKIHRSKFKFNKISDASVLESLCYFLHTAYFTAAFSLTQIRSWDNCTTTDIFDDLNDKN